MPCYNIELQNSYSDNCPSPVEIDKMIDYNSLDPFRNIEGPPNNSKLKVYWKRGDIHAKVTNKLKLTFKNFMLFKEDSYKSKLRKLKWVENSINSDFTKPSNNYNNPISLSICDIARKYGGQYLKRASDGQKNATFPNMLNGLAAGIEFIYKTYSNKNPCQMDIIHQGHVNADSSVSKDCIGMAVLRLRWVSDMCYDLGIEPNESLDLTDKDTLFCCVSAISKRETGVRFKKTFIEKAYQLFKEKN